MRRILLACAASLALYGAAFGLILDRPLSQGILAAELDARLARGAALPSPKLVILAGSNGPYSHSCALIGPALGLPCVNGGVAYGVGLDYLFDRWRPLLHPGDVVYLPMELAQYARGRAANRLGPDAAIMFRHDRATLAALPFDRWLGAFFSADLRDAAMSAIEMPLARLDTAGIRAATAGASNALGDHIGHTAALAAANRRTIDEFVREDPSPEAIAGGYGAQLIAGFVVWGSANGIRVIGGLPTEFADVPLPDETLDALGALYRGNGGAFLVLETRSRYPRSAFFDSPDHLDETWQSIHSRAVARGLARLLSPTAPRVSAER